MKLNCLPLCFPTVVGLDTETEWAVDNEPDPYRDALLTIQIDVPGDDTYILTENFEKAIPLLIDSSIIKIAHNMSFDSKFLLHNLKTQIVNVFDTFLAERILTAGYQRSAALDSVAFRRLNKTLNKGLRKKFCKGQLNDNLLEYAAQDAAVLYPIYQQQVQELEREGLTFVADLESQLSMVVGKIELAGIGFDPVQWDKILIEERKERDDAYKKVASQLDVPYQSDLFGDFTSEVNLNSRDQVMGLLAHQGIHLSDYRTSTLESYLRMRPKCTILQDLLDYKEHEKRLSWDYPKHVNLKTGRIHPNISQLGARTGRFAFSNPNLQQVPKLDSFRRMFRADNGYLFVTADYCVSGDTLVSKPNSITEIKNIKSSDIINTSSGTARIGNRFNNSNAELFEVRTRRGYSLKATENHRLRIVTQDGIKWKQVKELASGDWVVLSKNWLIGDNQVDLPPEEERRTNATALALPKKVNSRFAEFVGFLVGDGSIGPGGLQWLSRDSDVSEYFRGVFGVEIHSYTEDNYEICSRNLSRWLKKLHIKDKLEVPEIILRAGKSATSAFLRGLFEADGCASGDLVFLSTKSEKLAKQVQLLLLGLGITSTRRSCKQTTNFGIFDGWNVCIRTKIDIDLFEKEIGFISQRKQDMLKDVHRATRGSLSHRIPHLSKFIKKWYSFQTPSMEKRYDALVNHLDDRPYNRFHLNDLIAKYPDMKFYLPEYALNGNLYFDCIDCINGIGKQETFDLEVLEKHEYIASGFVVHNSQIELRVLAETAGDKAMIKAFKEGRDFHQATAELIAKNLRTNPDRGLGKNCNFAAVYGSSAGGLSASTGIPVKKWRQILKTYFETYSALEPWYQKSYNGLVKNGYTTTLSGRKRWFPELTPETAHKYQRVARNTPIQGGAQDILKLALIYVDKAIGGYDAQLVHAIHDEIIIEVVEEEANEVKDIVEREMMKAGTRFLQEVPVKVNLTVGPYWSK